MNLKLMAGKVSQWLFPPVCLSCQQALPPSASSVQSPVDVLCNECLGLLQPLNFSQACHFCGAVPFRDPPKPVPGRCAECATLPTSFNRAIGLFPYQGPVGMMIRLMKYRGAPYIAEHVVRLAGEVAPTQIHVALKGRLVIPAPMEALRQMRRGYNQAEEIARAFSRQSGQPLAPEVTLVRYRGGSPQARHRSREARLRNLEGLIEVRRPEAVYGNDVALIDDVMTTGSTVTQVSMELKKAGAKSVNVLTLVRARLGEEEDEQEGN